MERITFHRFTKCTRNKQFRNKWSWKNEYGITCLGRSLLGGLTVKDSYIDIKNLTISDSKTEDTLHIFRSFGSLDNLLINNSFSDGIDIDFSEITISNLKIRNIGSGEDLGDCLDISNSNIMIYNSEFSFCTDKSLSIGENSIVYMEESSIAFRYWNCNKR